MKDRTKKWLAVAGCLIVCVVLLVLITKQFNKTPGADAPPPTPTPSPTETVKPTPSVPVERIPVTVPPQPTPVTPAPTETPDKGGAVSTGTEQTIQPDPVKPSPSQEVLTDPSQKPDGTPVIESPKPVEHEKVSPQPNAPKPNGSGLPGFDNVPNGGANQGEYLEDMYENGNKIGSMD